MGSLSTEVLIAETRRRVAQISGEPESAWLDIIRLEMCRRILVQLGIPMQILGGVIEGNRGQYRLFTLSPLHQENGLPLTSQDIDWVGQAIDLHPQINRHSWRLVECVPSKLAQDFASTSYSVSPLEKQEQRIVAELQAWMIESDLKLAPCSKIPRRA